MLVRFVILATVNTTACADEVVFMDACEIEHVQESPSEFMILFSSGLSVYIFFCETLAAMSNVLGDFVALDTLEKMAEAHKFHYRSPSPYLGPRC